MSQQDDNESEAPGRVLVVLPILHTQADLGRAGESENQAIERFWELVKGWIESVDLPWEQVQVYQDGLPADDSDKVVQGVIDRVAAQGSVNFKLLCSLRESGASVLGTESPPLLQEELSLQQQLVRSGDNTELRERFADLTLRRDRFIAERIDATLPEGGIGLLFIGVSHSVEPQLPESIQVVHPIKL